jgi:hypothetical protein
MLFGWGSAGTLGFMVVALVVALPEAVSEKEGVVDDEAGGEAVALVDGVTEGVNDSEAGGEAETLDDCVGEFDDDVESEPAGVSDGEKDGVALPLVEAESWEADCDGDTLTLALTVEVTDGQVSATPEPVLAYLHRT